MKYQHGNCADNTYTFTSLIPAVCANYIAATISDLQIVEPVLMETDEKNIEPTTIFIAKTCGI